MDPVRILIALNNDASIGKLKSIFQESGYIVVDQAKDGSECLRKVRALKPDLAVVDYSLTNAWDAVKVAIEDDICDIILIANENQRSLIGSLTDTGRFVCMSKPLNKQSLINTINLMVKNKRKIDQLEKEIEELKATLDTRREVERAKGLLMKHLNLSEPEAFKRIQKQSMDKGIPMKEIAKAIILAYDI